MYEKITYINHINETVELGQGGIYVNANELHDYTWNYDSDNNKVSGFNRGIQRFKLPVVVACTSGDEGVATINSLLECSEKDVLSGMAGKIIINGYYMKCYVVGSKKKNYNAIRGFINAELTIVSDYPAWISESTTGFSKSGSSGTNLDYSYDFPYDFASFGASKTLINPSFMPVDFTMRIYGPCSKPSIYINGHNYAVNLSASSGAYIEIDSREKTVYLVANDGSRTNYFSSRNKESYIFEKIASGEVAVTWEGNYNFDITLYEERSEPKWI